MGQIGIKCPIPAKLQQKVMYQLTQMMEQFSVISSLFQCVQNQRLYASERIIGKLKQLSKTNRV